MNPEKVAKSLCMNEHMQEKKTSTNSLHTECKTVFINMEMETETITDSHDKTTTQSCS